jgi:heat shock protein HtpX
VRGAVALNFLKLVALTAIVCGAWAALGWALDGFYGLVLFLFASLLVGTAVVWHGERMLLAMLHAREVPLGELPHIHSTLERIALKARVPKPRLYLIEDGHLRSLSAGTGPRRSGIAITRGLLSAARAEEVEGLLAHEIAHIRRRDVAVQTLVALLTLTILELSRLGWRAQGALLYVLGPLAASFTNAFVAPKRELRADAYAAALVDSPHGLADALLRLELAGELVVFAENPATEPLYVVNPFGDDRLAALFETHPPIGDRVRALRALDASSQNDERPALAGPS